MAEHYRIGREYNRQTLFRDRRLQYFLATRSWLIQDAIKALPEHLVASAKILDESIVDIPLPEFHTPPIPDFDYEKYVKMTEEVSNEQNDQSNMDDDD